MKMCKIGAEKLIPYVISEVFIVPAAQIETFSAGSNSKVPYSFVKKVT